VEEFDAALEDANACIAAKADWPKGYGRKGAALYGLRKYEEAIAAYDEGLKIDPTNETLRSGLADVKQAEIRATQGPPADAMGGIGQMLSSPELYGKIAMDPTTRGFLAQPDFVAMLTDVQKNPSSFSKYMSDERMMKVLSLALGLNVMSGEEAMKGGGPFGEKPKGEAPVDITGKPVELGNAAYKAKDFDLALKHYDAAIALDDEDVSFLTNKAAVNFEKGDYDACIECCDDAIEKGRELRVDYKMVARAMTRKGNALVKKDMLEEAIEVYAKSLMEHRNADTLKRKNDTEKLLKDRTVAAYIDPAKAEEARERGNTLFKEQKYPEAVAEYTEAIKRNPDDHRVYSNRAACYTKLAAFNEATKDAEKCIELEPTFAKGYTRKGHVEFFTKQFDKALETYQAGLAHDPNNEELKDGLRRAMVEIQKGSTGQVSEEEMKERQARAMADPEIQNILQDPVMRQVLNDFGTDPKAAAEHQKNPAVMAKVQKLINAGVVQVR
jgi:stress-induced-phosphoprotein 1